MKQPLRPLLLQQDYPYHLGSVLEEDTFDNGFNSFLQFGYDWGKGSIWEIVSNGFTFSYQEWTLLRKKTETLTSATGGTILHFLLTGVFQLVLPGKTLNLASAVATVGVHPVGGFQTLHLEAGKYQYLQIALSAPLSHYLLNTIPIDATAFPKKRRHPPFYLPIPLSKRLKNSLATVRKEILSGNPDLLVLNYLGLQILSSFKSDAKRFLQRKTWEAKKEIKLEELEAYIDDHLDTEDRKLLRSTALAKMVRLPRHSFTALFLQRYGQRPSEFIRSRRMKTALQLLQQGKAPGDIYTSVGFEDFAAFTKSFTRWYGKSPNQFRKKE